MNVRALHRLTKPGVTYGNLITAAAGFLFATKGNIDLWVFIFLTTGTWCMIASACVINNYLDRDIDAVMTRTKKRPLLTGEVLPNQALIFGGLLCIIGVTLLVVFTNYLVVTVGLVGFVTYVWLYGMLSKRKSVHGTLVGAISGAAPILAGYVAARGSIDSGAVLVFAVLFFWQMPEFYSIAIYRKKEYAAAGIPIISVKKGVDVTVRHIFFFTAAFGISALLLTVLSYTSMVYGAVMGAGCLYWLWLAGKGLRTDDHDQWSRSMFKFSMVILLVFSLLISIDTYLP